MNYKKPKVQFTETIEVSGRLFRIPFGFRAELTQAHWAHVERVQFKGQWVTVEPGDRSVTVRLPQTCLRLTDAGDIAFLFLEAR